MVLWSPPKQFLKKFVWSSTFIFLFTSFNVPSGNMVISSYFFLRWSDNSQWWIVIVLQSLYVNHLNFVAFLDLRDYFVGFRFKIWEVGGFLPCESFWLRIDLDVYLVCWCLLLLCWSLVSSFKLIATSE